MSPGLARVRRDGSTAVFELDRPADLTGALLDSLDWTGDTPKAAFRFKEPATEASLPDLSVLPGTYIARIGYAARTADLAAPAAPPPASKGEWRTPTDLEALKTLTRTTLIERFYEPWRELESPEFLKDVEAFLEHGLALDASALFLVEGREAGLIAMMAHRDCFGRPVDHIAWVWIDESLTPPERAGAHARLVEWLARKPSGRIQAFVHGFNARSRRFFGKIGFTPTCLHISRRP